MKISHLLNLPDAGKTPGLTAAFAAALAARSPDLVGLGRCAVGGGKAEPTRPSPTRPSPIDFATDSPAWSETLARFETSVKDGFAPEAPLVVSVLRLDGRDFAVCAQAPGGQVRTRVFDLAVLDEAVTAVAALRRPRLTGILTFSRDDEAHAPPPDDEADAGPHGARRGLVSFTRSSNGLEWTRTEVAVHEDGWRSLRTYRWSKDGPGTFRPPTLWFDESSYEDAVDAMIALVQTETCRSLEGARPYASVSTGPEADYGPSGEWGIVVAARNKRECEFLLPGQVPVRSDPLTATERLVELATDLIASQRISARFALTPSGP